VEPQDLKVLCGDLLENRISPDYFALYICEYVIANRGKYQRMYRIAQALYFMPPVGGDG
jgi:hypothetical protein